MWMLLISIALGNQTGICTKDLNRQGYASHCECLDEDLIYNEEIGSCEFIPLCYRDVNEFGHPSFCTCEYSHQEYNERTGSCEGSESSLTPFYPGGQRSERPARI